MPVKSMDGTPGYWDFQGGVDLIVDRKSGDQWELLKSGQLYKANDSSNQSFVPSGTGAVTRTVQAKLREIITPEDFGAVGNGTSDDLTPLTNFINAVTGSSGMKIGLMPPKTYAISGSLPNIASSGVVILGCGYSANHDVGSIGGTVIKKITNAGGTMLTIAPTEGASAQRLDGITLKGIAFDCNSLAAKGVVWKSTRYSDIDIACIEATTTGFELNCSTTLGEATSLQSNRIRYLGRQTTNTAVSLRLSGTSAGNPSFNYFEMVDIVHKNEIGIIEDNADNNRWGSCRVFRAAGGSATNSIEWRGGASAGVTCRSETFDLLSTTVAAIAKGTGTYTVGANAIYVIRLDTDNSTPAPTEEAGASIYDNQWRTYTPTVTSGTGTFTSVTGSGRYRRIAPGKIYVEVKVSITTNGTAASFIRATLPVTADAALVVPNFLLGKRTGGGNVCIGTVSAATAQVDIQDYAAVYPGADGRDIYVTGEYAVSYTA